MCVTANLKTTFLPARQDRTEKSEGFQITDTQTGPPVSLYITSFIYL